MSREPGRRRRKRSMATIAPTERSIWRAMMTSACADATMHTSVADSATCSRLATVEEARLAQRDASADQDQRQQRSFAPRGRRSRRAAQRAARGERSGAPRGRHRADLASALLARGAWAAASSIASRSNAARANSRDDAAAAEHQDAVGHGDQLAGIVADQDDRHALGRQLRNDAVDLGLGADVDAARRLVEDQEPGRGISHLASSTFCWLPPESVPVTCSMPVDDDPHAARRSRARPCARARGRCGRAGRTEPRSTGKVCVGADRRRAAPAPAGGGPRAPAKCRAASPRAASAAGPSGPSIRISPRVGGTIPNSISAISERPAPTSPKKPEDLAGAHSKLDIARRSPRRTGRAR